MATQPTTFGGMARLLLGAGMALALTTAGTMATASGEALTTRTQQQIVDDISALVEIQTYRVQGNEATVQANLKKIQDIFKGRMTDFNGLAIPHKLSFFEWKSPAEADGFSKYWVFGFRTCDGAQCQGLRKTSIIAHLDTVPPGNMDWNPFKPRQETRLYNGAPAPFLIGRGSVDDKGPAVVSFDVLIQALESVKDDPHALDGIALEVMFDTSEETEMSMPHYFTANPGTMPALGIVLDAFWSVRAEKGIERVIFSVAPSAVSPAPSASALAIHDLRSAEGAINMIPTSATAVIKGSDTGALDAFAAGVDGWYRAHSFDDPGYHPAALRVTRSGTDVVLTTQVAGAQHGSAPAENRANGANPVVSLTNFLAALVDRGTLANNGHGEMSRFVRWAFGTRAFGENHPDLLLRNDPVFQAGNGTSYALTQLLTDSDPCASQPDPTRCASKLGVDIRYALGHHGTGWDGSQILLSGPSVFKSVFSQLVEKYRAEAGGAAVTFETKTSFGPDLRSPRNPNLFRVNAAYRAVMGTNSPMIATGGGTDAKGYPELVAAGALFTENMGPPVNFHGLDEGVPLNDLTNSAAILLSLFKQELGSAERPVEHHLGSARHHQH